jgi:hypothetical protein
LFKQAGAQALGISMLLSDLANATTDNFQDEVSRQKGLEGMIQQLRSRALQQASSTRCSSTGS